MKRIPLLNCAFFIYFANVQSQVCSKEFYYERALYYEICLILISWNGHITKTVEAEKKFRKEGTSTRVRSLMQGEMQMDSLKIGDSKFYLPNSVICILRHKMVQRPRNYHWTLDLFATKL